jgi:hypothetical protein
MTVKRTTAFSDPLINMFIATTSITNPHSKYV